MVAVLLIAVVATKAQGSLQFSRALIVSSSLETVPAGKVWKITSLYGEDYGSGSCVQFGTYYYDYILQAGYKINGNLVGVQYGTASNCQIRTGSCSGTLINGGQPCNSSGWVDRVNNAQGNTTIEDMNASLPMWIPAGTTVQTLGSTSFLSVLEFNIIP